MFNRKAKVRIKVKMVEHRKIRSELTMKQNEILTKSTRVYEFADSIDSHGDIFKKTISVNDSSGLKLIRCTKWNREEINFRFNDNWTLART